MLNVTEFGKQLLDAGDLDPVYAMLWDAQLEPDLLDRWLIAYWCFYHAGTASWIARNEEGYWARFLMAAASKDYPRCHERRHYRGENAMKSATWLSECGVPCLMNPIRDKPKWTAKALIDYVRTWVGFGPWIGFKVADMVDRLAISEVVFDEQTAFYKGSPQEGADLLWELDHGYAAEPGQAVPYAADKILAQLGGYLAPPRNERTINLQEVETILCKWKSYRGGHYRIGEDVEGLREALLRFGAVKLSQRLLKAAPRVNTEV